jgi:hypothetical protein
VPQLLFSFSAIIAGCWSSLLFFGMEGYVETTRRIVSTAKVIEAG